MNIKRYVFAFISVASLLLSTKSNADDIYQSQITQEPIASSGENYYANKSTTYITLPDKGGKNTTITSVNVPSGTWHIMSEATLTNDLGLTDIMRCEIRANRTVIDSGSATNGLVSILINQGILVTTKKQTKIDFNCAHDTYTNASGYYTVHPGASLIAVRVPPKT